MSKTYEYEERAFLTEESFSKIKASLDALAISSELDNKNSYFFVLPDVNVSIAASAKKTVVKYKGGQIGLGNGFEEYEFTIQPESLSEALKLFTALLGLEPQLSEQFRINYTLPDSIEVALKYTQTWGFHLEAEKVYTVRNEDEHAAEKQRAKDAIAKFADELDISYITDEEMKQFKIDSENGIVRGEYTPEDFSKKYTETFKLG